MTKQRGTVMFSHCVSYESRYSALTACRSNADAMLFQDIFNDWASTITVSRTHFLRRKRKTLESLFGPFCRSCGGYLGKNLRGSLPGGSALQTPLQIPTWALPRWPKQAALPSYPAWISLGSAFPQVIMFSYSLLGEDIMQKKTIPQAYRMIPTAPVSAEALAPWRQ